MSMHTYRAAWLARFKPSIPGAVMSARDVAVLMALVGRITDLPADPLEPAQVDMAVTLGGIAEKNDTLMIDFSFARMRQALGLRNSRDLSASLDRMPHVHINGRQAFSKFWYLPNKGSDNGMIGVEIASGRQVVGAHPLFDIEAKTRRGIARIDTRRLGKVSCLHTYPIATRAIAWHRCDYDHGLSHLIERKRVDGYVLVTMEVDDINKALGLSGTLRVRELRSLQARIDADLLLFGLTVHWKWKGSGRKPSHLTMTIGDAEKSTEVEPDDMTIAPQPIRPLPIRHTKDVFPNEQPVAPATNVLAFPTPVQTVEDAFMEQFIAPSNGCEPDVLDVDEHNRPPMCHWLTATQWPSNLDFGHKHVPPYDLPMRWGDFGVNKSTLDLPVAIECRFWRPSLIRTPDEFAMIDKALAAAEKLRGAAEQGDYDADVGIDRDSEDGYAEPSDADAWDQPPPRSYLDAEDQDEGYNTHVDVD